MLDVLWEEEDTCANLFADFQDLWRLSKDIEIRRFDSSERKKEFHFVSSSVRIFLKIFIKLVSIHFWSLVNFFRTNNVLNFLSHSIGILHWKCSQYYLCLSLWFKLPWWSSNSFICSAEWDKWSPRQSASNVSSIRSLMSSFLITKDLNFHRFKCISVKKVLLIFHQHIRQRLILVILDWIVVTVRFFRREKNWSFKLESISTRFLWLWTIRSWWHGLSIIPIHFIISKIWRTSSLYWVLLLCLGRDLRWSNLGHRWR